MKKQYINGLLFMVLAACYLAILDPPFSIGNVIFFVANIIIDAIMTYAIMEKHNAL